MKTPQDRKKKRSALENEEVSISILLIHSNFFVDPLCRYRRGSLFFFYFIYFFLGPKIKNMMGNKKQLNILVFINKCLEDVLDSKFC